MKTIKKEHGYDLKKLDFLGKGTQGSVYRIDNEKCIKIFKKSSVCKMELEALKMAQDRKYFPKLYDWGSNFIVREYVEGIELDKYLATHPLTIDISEKLIEIYEVFRDIGFNRRDTALLHVFITEEGDLKVIDSAKAMIKHSKLPNNMINDLRNLGCKETFLLHLSILNPTLYKTFYKSFL